MTSGRPQMLPFALWHALTVQATLWLSPPRRSADQQAGNFDRTTRHPWEPIFLCGHNASSTEQRVITKTAATRWELPLLLLP